MRFIGVGGDNRLADEFIMGVNPDVKTMWGVDELGLDFMMGTKFGGIEKGLHKGIFAHAGLDVASPQFPIGGGGGTAQNQAKGIINIGGVGLGSAQAGKQARQQVNQRESDLGFEGHGVVGPRFFATVG